MREKAKKVQTPISLFWMHTFNGDFKQHNGEEVEIKKARKERFFLEEWCLYFMCKWGDI